MHSLFSVYFFQSFKYTYKDKQTVLVKYVFVIYDPISFNITPMIYRIIGVCVYARYEGRKKGVLIIDS